MNAWDDKAIEKSATTFLRLSTGKDNLIPSKEYIDIYKKWLNELGILHHE